MTDTSPRVLAFTGSLRLRSFNRLALRYAIEGAREAGGDAGRLKDAKQVADLAALGRSLVLAARAGVGRL